MNLDRETFTSVNTIAPQSGYEAELEACVGAQIGTTSISRHPVNHAMIGMWVDALRDRNPVYVDEAAARATGRTGIVAPPTMIQAWTMPPLSQMAQNRSVPGYRPYWAGEDPRRSGDGPGSAAYRVLFEHGFSNSAATNCQQTYHRELVPGDHTKCVTTLESISPLKHTAMGSGHFITTRMEYLDHDDQPVATQLWTVLQFRAPSEEELRAASESRADRVAATAPEPEPPGTPGGDLAGRPAVDQRTAVTIVPITPTFVIATAIATHDFYAIHHDTDWARSIGRPDIFTNILTTTGLVGQVATDWAGPATRLRSVDLRLLAPNYPGDELRLDGVVRAVDGDTAVLEVIGTNGLGQHVRATVVAEVPGE